MEIERRMQGATWRYPLLIAVVFLNVCMPGLVLSYGTLLVQSVSLGQSTWLGLLTPTLYIITFCLTQCWCRDAADSWGGPTGYRVLAALGLLMVVTSLLLSAFVTYHLQPYIFGILGGLGSSLMCAQMDAVIFDTYDSRLGVIRGVCFIAQAVGQSLFPHIISALVDCYGYSTSYIMLAGIVLQSLPAIMLLRINDDVKRPVSFSRYSDLSKTYALFSDGIANNYYATELQLHDLSKKCWKSPSDDNLHREDREEELQEDDFDDEMVATITPPPSPEEKRRNIFGVEILPEIPEESEESDDFDSDDEQNASVKDVNKNKKRLSVAIKRLSIMGDNFDEFIAKQSRRDSETDNKDIREYSEVEVTYDNISPVTDIQREKILNSFSFRCQSAYASMRRRMWMPSYRVYRLKRRLSFLIYNINDTFIKPLCRSLVCWKFYPALILCFSKLSLTAISLMLLPMIASQMHPTISMTETNFLMSIHGFTWICFLLSTPWLVQTPKRNMKYVVVFGLLISTVACFVLAIADDHDSFSIGCVVGGLGYGAITSCWEPAVQEFVGARLWPKLHSPIETLSSVLLAGFFVGIGFVIDQEGGLQLVMFILAIIMSIVTLVWMVLSIALLYITKVRSLRQRRNCLF